MRNEVPKPSAPVIVVMSERTKRRLRRIAAKASKLGGAKFSRSFLVEYLVSRADPEVIAAEVADGVLLW